jgi:uracil DNA glycosylase
MDSKTDSRDIKMEPSWKEHLVEEFGKEYFRALTDFVKKMREQNDLSLTKVYLRAFCVHLMR